MKRPDSDLYNRARKIFQKWGPDFWLPENETGNTKPEARGPDGKFTVKHVDWMNFFNLLAPTVPSQSEIDKNLRDLPQQINLLRDSEQNPAKAQSHMDDVAKILKEINNSYAILLAQSHNDMSGPEESISKSAQSDDLLESNFCKDKLPSFIRWVTDFGV